MNEEIKSILKELEYDKIFEQLKIISSLIRLRRREKDNKKNEKDNIISELNYRENELLETVYISTLEWKEKKKPNNDETRKNYLEILKHEDSAYQTSKARLSSVEKEFNQISAGYEESTNKLKSSTTLANMIIAKIELINKFKSAKVLEV